MSQYRLTVLALPLLCLVLLGCTQPQDDERAATNNTPGSEHVSEEVAGLNDEALALIREGESVEALERALGKLDKAVSLEPEWEALQGNRITVLLELERYPAAIEAIEDLIALTGYQQHGLMLCMTKEVAAGPDADKPHDCYQHVADRLREEKGSVVVEDVNYILLLKMAESQEFPEAVNAFLSKSESDVEREFYEGMLLEQSRDQLLQDMFGHPAGRG